MKSLFSLRKLFVYFAFLLCAFTPGRSYGVAGRYCAAYIYADYVDSGASGIRYKVTLWLYQLCSSSAPGHNTTEEICWQSPACLPGLGTKTKTIKCVDSSEIDPFCPSYTTSCHSATSTYPGYKKFVFSDTIALGGGCPDWVVAWAPADNYQSNITSVGLSSSLVTGDARCYINNQYPNLALSSTPRFTAEPNFYFCPNTNDVFQTSPVDPYGATTNTTIASGKYDGGTLSCFTSYNLGSSYVASYGPASPFGTATVAWNLDPVSGTGTVTPTTNGNFIISIRTDAYDSSTGSPPTYRGGTYMWAIVNVNSNNCGSTNMTMDTLPESVTGGTLDTINRIIRTCANTKVTFSVKASSANTGDVFYMSSNYASVASGSNVTFSGNGSSSVVGNFDWTPGAGDVGDHVITFVAIDSACSGTQVITTKKYFTIDIKVQYSVIAWTKDAYCPPVNHGDKASLMDTMYVSGPPGAFFTWTDLGTLPSTLSVIGANGTVAIDSPEVTTQFMVVSSVTTGCKDTGYVTVNVYNPIVFDAGAPITICQNQSVTLQPTPAFTISNFIDTFAWSQGSFTWPAGTTLVTPSTQKPTFTAKGGVPSYSDSILLHITDSHQCNYLDTAVVNVVGEAPNLYVFAQPDSVCPEGSSQLTTFISGQGGTKCGSFTTTKPSGDSTISLTDIDTAKFSSSHPSGAVVYGGGDPNIFETWYYGGQRQQILYTADELRKGGMKPGYLSSMAFNFMNIGVSDSFYKFTIRMACTSLTDLPTTGGHGCFATLGGPIIVFGGGAGKTILPDNNGWFTFPFSNFFYWDGNSNVIVDMCYSKPYYSSSLPYGAVDAISITPTTNVSSVWSNEFYTGASATTPPGVSGCSISCGSTYYDIDILAANARPTTAFSEYVQVGLYDYSWSPATYLSCTNCAEPVVSRIGQKTCYTVTVYAKTSPACKNTATICVAIDTTNKVSAIPRNIVMCRPGYQQFSALASGPGPWGNIACGTNNPVTCATTTSVSPGNRVNAAANWWASPFYDYGAKDQWIIQRSELNKAQMHAGTIKQITLYPYPYSGGSYPNICSNFEIRIGCTTKDSYANLADTIPSSSMTMVYSTPSLTLVSGPMTFPFTVPYNWDTTKNLVFQICWGYNTEYDWLVSTVLTTYSSCINFYSGYPNGICAGSVSVGNYYGRPINERPYVTIDYCPLPPLSSFTYTWTPGTFLNDSNLQSPTAYVNNPGKVTVYNVYTSGRNGCRVHDSVNIYQPLHHYAIFPKDTAFCEGGSAKLGVKGSGKTYTYQWYENGYQTASDLSCNTCANPVAMPHNFGTTNVDTFTFQLVVTDSVGCSDTVFSKLEVKPIPIVKTLTHDTMINYNGQIQLFATGATVYTWSPTSSLSNPNIVDPIAFPKEPTTYIVRGLSSNGCTATDSERVTINYHGDVFVPSAFTPNGDGKNDRFRIANLTFEKVLEFHVFNRWGQELFFATDNSGWDGTWHSVAQDIGVYQYLIRVASPDGTIQTFKGDVTLLR